jgi:uncharacterized FAD-dependent dehydrogenase
MDAVIEGLESDIISTVRTIRGACISLVKRDAGWSGTILTNSGEVTIASSEVVVAAGRSSNLDLIASGATPTSGKGLDVGFRVEFAGAELTTLRSLGPDAKLIMGPCRTFCLNVPGKIFPHFFRGISIPGGVVADPDTSTSNVGILCRLNVEKNHWLEGFLTRVASVDRDLKAPLFSSGPVSKELDDLLGYLYGRQAAQLLREFIRSLHEKKLVDFDSEHKFYLPLLDWYWNTFSLENTFRSSVPSLYVIGDQSGHARGLLQAAVSGWLVAEEMG